MTTLNDRWRRRVTPSIVDRISIQQPDDDPYYYSLDNTVSTPGIGTTTRDSFRELTLPTSALTILAVVDRGLFVGPSLNDPG